MAMTRITTNMIMRNYQNNLTSTLGGLESARKQVETGRRFSKSYEDPSASAKAAILERRYARNYEYLENAENVQKWQDTQEDAINGLVKLASTVTKDYSVQAVNGTNQDESTRKTFAQTLRSMQGTLLNTINAKYGDTFVLSGNAGDKPPFEYDAENNILTYRGIDVNTTDPDELETLKQLSNEHTYMDLGFGLTFSNGEIVPSSALDAALPAINAIGYGKTDDGTSKNMFILLGQMADELEKPNFNADEYKKLWNQVEDINKNLNDQLANLGVKTQLITSTTERLENEKLAIETQFDSAVNIEPAEAIMNYSWANYAYNSALKVGTSIITPSLLDFLK